MSLENTIAEVLRHHRKQKGLSQEQLALLSGLDRSYISLIERGKRQPTLNTIFQISKALEVSPSKLVQEIEQRNENT
ncbi:helix-turn-helix domain-containing protein [Halalkalibacterium halodurans]|uniref:helix-turn-helix domain-containing protein n=1 Tax=Halalkalibacterium halodurans TaxID=86665 RepID=UPI002AAA3CFB|nr:helix-turn-helix transcriptional regulator [Halalkalibacterium halodurans]MDY7220679.1 helix-turn-helix transcriptional regulator [Halalkalibacterium halodurans]MDY7239918.1 helix-turn-helix transcriptional regulator [Halalkalibacterium halodurans]